jgi:hypothetical protein
MIELETRKPVEAPNKPEKPARKRHKPRPELASSLILAIPVAICSAVAFSGQLAWMHEHLKWGWPGQILMALALESIGLFYAWQTYQSELANDAAMRPRIAAYGAACLAGLLNYSHYSSDMRPTPVALITAYMSMMAPFLAMSWSRRISRNALAKQGLIEPHAVRLGMARRFYYPVKSYKVSRYAAWHGQNVPAKAIDEYTMSARERALAKDFAELDLDTSELAI